MVANGEPPEPCARKTKLCGIIANPPFTVPEGFHELEIPGPKRIVFFAALPVCESEMNLKSRLGADELIERFNRKGVADLADITRKEVSRKVLGIELMHLRLRSLAWPNQAFAADLKPCRRWQRSGMNLATATTRTGPRSACTAF
jgi:hypothetical protein